MYRDSNLSARLLAGAVSVTLTVLRRSTSSLIFSLCVIVLRIKEESLKSIETNLLRGDIYDGRPQIDLRIVFNAGQDKENPCKSRQRKKIDHLPMCVWRWLSCGVADRLLYLDPWSLRREADPAWRWRHARTLGQPTRGKRPLLSDICNVHVASIQISMHFWILYIYLVYFLLYYCTSCVLSILTRKSLKKHFNAELTLKHTHSEKGSVTATRPQEMAVSSQPQRPIPLSDSSAGKDKKRNLGQLCFSETEIRLVLYQP